MSPPPEDVAARRNDAARRSVTGRVIRSALWAGGAAPLVLAMGFVRSVLLARLLPVEVFGVYAMASAIVGLSGAAAQLGLRDALLREDDGGAAAAPVHFTLVLAATSAWALLLVAGASALASGELATALVVLALAHAGWHLTLTPRALLVGRLAQRRLAAFAVADAVLGAVVAVLLAGAGFGIGALLAVDVVRSVLALPTFYAWRPVFRPRLAGRGAPARRLLRFGSRTLLVDFLDAALARLDKLWLGVVLDATALGLYSRAYRFARMPGNLLGGPLLSVGGGAFAAVAVERERLSRAVLQVTSLAVRGSVPVAGALAAVAPEFVRVLLGERWLPMVPAFRILALAFPLAFAARTLGRVFPARGDPGALVRVRAVQVASLAAALLALTPWLGGEGAAAGVAAAGAVGLALSLRRARQHVDVPAARLLGPPAAALGVALAGAAGVAAALPAGAGDLVTGAAKVATVGLLYAAVLGLLEGRELAHTLARLLRESSR